MKTALLQPAPSVEPLMSQDDFARVLNAGRRTVERMRAAGRLPKPDLHVGKMPRWRPESVRAWLDSKAWSN
jgi:predicted DNA-binding transcriptional regulator AlpA